MARFHRSFKVLALAAVLGGGAAFAQTPGAGTQDLETRLDRMEQHLDLLQTEYRRPASAAGAGNADLPAGLAARMEVRLGEFDSQLRALTGQIEELRHAMAALSLRLEKLVEDVEFRMRDLAAGSPPGGTGPPRLAAAPAGGEAVEVSGLPGQAPASGLLGTISPADLAAINPDGAAAPGTMPGAAEAGPREPVLPEGTVKEQYAAAFALLRQGDYARAEQAFSEFIERHRGDSLAGNAQYWLGETFYVRRDYDRAAATFLGVMQDFPDSAKQPDSMLKLGMSLSAIGQKEEACATFAALTEKFSSASAMTLRRSRSESRRAGCG